MFRFFRGDRSIQTLDDNLTALKVGQKAATLAYLKRAGYPERLGIGIDEDTCAMFERDGMMTVIGCGTVTVIDAREMSHTNHHHVTANEPLSLQSCSNFLLESPAVCRLLAIDDPWRQYIRSAYWRLEVPESVYHLLPVQRTSSSSTQRQPAFDVRLWTIPARPVERIPHPLGYFPAIHIRYNPPSRIHEASLRFLICHYTIH